MFHKDDNRLPNFLTSSAVYTILNISSNLLLMIAYSISIRMVIFQGAGPSSSPKQDADGNMDPSKVLFRDQSMGGPPIATDNDLYV